MKNIAVACFCLFFNLNLWSQNNDEVVLTIEGESVTVSEFEAIYNKNNNRTSAIDPKGVEDYMELFINFKLKVKEAEARGLDTNKTFTTELEGYRKQLAQPYLTDNQMTDELIQEAYNRLQYDVRASHILIRVAPDALPTDTLKALTRIKSIANTIKNPEKEFGKAAAEMSEDPSARENFGDLGYFTAFQMVYPFESAAFNTPVGKVSKPIRTRFGYHLVYVQDKRPARGEIRAAHILIKSDENFTEEEQEKAKQKVYELHQRIKNGESFETLASQYSDDKSSALKGGELPWFGTNKMVMEFEDAAFALKNNGDISEPVKTQFGWHIIKRLDKKELASFQEMEKELKRKVSRDGRAAISKTSFIAKLKTEYQFTPNQKNIDEVKKLINEEFFEGRWTAKSAENMTKPVFTLTDNTYSKTTKTFTQYHFAKFLENNKKYERNKENLAAKDQIIQDLFANMVELELLKLEESNLEQKHPEFKALMREYRDGILLFELMDDLVWSKAVKDSIGLNTFYEANKNQFMWGERVEAKIFICENEALAKKAKKLAKKQIKKGIEDKEIEDKLNVNSQLGLKIKSGTFSKGDDPLVDKVNWQPGLTDNFMDNGKVIFINIINVLPPQPKSLNEARGLITAAYQTHLEQEWIKELKSKFTYQVNKQALSKVK